MGNWLIIIDFGRPNGQFISSTKPGKSANLYAHEHSSVVQETKLLRAQSANKKTRIPQRRPCSLKNPNGAQDASFACSQASIGTPIILLYWNTGISLHACITTVAVVAQARDCRLIAICMHGAQDTMANNVIT